MESQRRIRVLPDPLIDQIAAGEVVERPASVVKELVENAIDAEARRIRVEVREGGIAWIAVADDGTGMEAEDARLALERHATSKIAAAGDLERIATFGFRGEALPSIAAVSRVRIRSRARGAPEGVEIRVEAGRVLETRSAAGPEGTRVEVADLFSGVPARRKFLKTPVTEWGHIADWLARIALALPALHFELHRDDRPATHWPGVEDPLDRIAAVLSEPDAAALVAVESQVEGMRLHGFVSRPDHHRSSAAGIHLFVNRRPIRDRLIRHALLETYRDVLPRGRFPAAVLFLEVDAGRIDVNVHPAKWEVRFLDPRAAHRLVVEAARGAFGERRWLAGGEPARSPQGSGATPSRPASSDWLFARGSQEAGAAEAAAPSVREVPGHDGELGLRFGGLPLLGQLLAGYLVLEAPDGLLLVDQHAAHERILYERLRERWREGKVERQALLTPETVELPAGPATRLAAVASELERVGIELEPFGPASFAVRAVPALLAGRSPRSIVVSIADELEPGESERFARGDLEATDRLFASLACHGARRLGDRLVSAEQRALLEALDTIPWSPTCPHGRPVAVPISREEIERRFARR